MSIGRDYSAGNRLLPGILLLLLAAWSSNALANTCNAVSSGTFSDPSIWNNCGGTFPQPTDTASIDGNGVTVTLAANRSIAGLVFNSSNANNRDNGLVVGSYTLTVNGDISLNGGANNRTVSLSLSTGAVTVTGNINVTTGGNVNIGVSGAGTINVGGNFDSGANYTPSGSSTVNYNGTGAQSIGIYTYNNLSVNKTAGTASLSGNVTVNNNLSVGTSGGTLDLGSFTANRATSGGTLTVVNGATLKIGGTNGLPANYTTYTFGASSTEEFNGTNQTVSNKTYGNLTLSGSGTKTLTAGTTTIQGTFTLGSGVIYNGTANNPTVNLAGNFSNSGTFNSGTGVFTFNGANAQSLTGATTFTNMTLNNGNGLTLNNSATVTGTLNFSNGKITTAAGQKVIIGSAGTITNNSGSRYVVGTMEKVFTSAGSFTFAVGDASNYTPVDLTFTSLTTTGSLDVSQTPGDHPNIGTSQLDPTLSVNRYWTLASVGGLAGTYNATFNYVTGDKDGAANPPDFNIQRYSGGTWTDVTVTNRVGNSITGSGITGFGDFAIAEPGGQTLNHYVISHAGTAVNCAPAVVTITGHKSNHTVITTITNSINLTTSTGHGDWTLNTGLGTFTPGPSNSGTATYGFVSGDNGTASFNLRDTYPETVNINVADGNGVTENTGTANNGSEPTPTDPNLVFVNSGFRITNAGNSATTIGQQIAGKESSIGPGAQTLAVQAIRTDTSTFACQAVFANNTTVNVDMAFECNDPTTCSAGKSVNITNNSITTAIAGNSNGSVAAYTSVPLKFSGANSEAPFTFNYPDAGIIKLYMRRNIPLGGGGGSGNYMSGSSNSFVVRPFAFYVSAAGNPAATDASGTVYTKAGQNFTANISAVVWQAGDDLNNDGVPDSTAALSDNAVTPNYGNETTPEPAAITRTLLAPAGGQSGTLTGGTSVSFTNGTGSATLSWSEVGVIRLDAALVNSPYLSSTDNITGSSRATGNTTGNVGRFTPDHFTVAYNTPQFATACPAGNFTYIGQTFHYATAPVMTVTARNAGGGITRNYTGTSPAASAWFKLTDTSLTSDPAFDTQAERYTAASGTLDLSLLPAVSSDPAVVDLGAGNPASASAGLASLTFSDGGGFAFTHNTLTGPFDAEISLALSVVDSDSVALTGNPARFGAASAGNGMAFNNGKTMRFGRLNIINAAGSELLPLSLPLRTEYYNGTAWVTNTGDSCTALTLASDFALSNPQTGGGAPQSGSAVMTVGVGTSQVTSGNPSFTSGISSLTFSAPGAGNTGYIDVEALLSGAGRSYLQYDWDNDGMFNNDPTGRVTFGIYTAPNGVIYIREPW